MVSSLHDISPLYPEERVATRLHELAAELFSINFQNDVSGSLLDCLRPLLRVMNSYYTNRIEGQHTRPRDLKRALSREIDQDGQVAKLQRLALAHLEAEEKLESAYGNAPIGGLYSESAISTIHRMLYETLPEEERVTDTGEPIIPGEFRLKDVSVGRHKPPVSKEIPDYLSHWKQYYRSLPAGEKSLIGIAAAHHRLLWIHPFIDGNGRAVRLHSHLLLTATGVTGGIWSIMRGLARNHAEYYKHLDNADAPRKGDLDGRGNLSQDELVNFIEFFLGVCIDQSRFMKDMLQIHRLKENIGELLLHLSAHPWQIGSEKSFIKMNGLEALHYVAIAGPVERGKFVSMTGLEERSGRRMLATLLDYGVLSSESHRAPVRFSVPLESLHYLFPRLWPEAEADFS